jgi:hypothetical protein
MHAFVALHRVEHRPAANLQTIPGKTCGSSERRTTFTWIMERRLVANRSSAETGEEVRFAPCATAGQPAHGSWAEVGARAESGLSTLRCAVGRRELARLERAARRWVRRANSAWLPQCILEELRVMAPATISLSPRRTRRTRSRRRRAHRSAAVWRLVDPIARPESSSRRSSWWRSGRR